MNRREFIEGLGSARQLEQEQAAREAHQRAEPEVARVHKLPEESV